MKDLDIVGNWWLPSRPDLRLGGILRFNQPDWPRLELTGAFESAFSNPSKFQDIILGISNDGKFVTLYQCHENSRTYSSMGIETTGYACIFGFVGKHFEKPEELRFQQARLGLTHFFEWVGSTVVEQEIESVPKRKVTLSLSTPEEIVLPGRYCDYVCVFGVSIKHTKNEHALHEVRALEIRANKKRKVELFLQDLIQPFQHFLTLATSEPSFVENLKFRCKDDVWVESFYAQRSFRFAEKELREPHMLFTLKDVFDRRNRAIKRWTLNAKRMHEVRQLYVDVVRTSDMFLQHKFLNVIQALETFHRRNMKNEILDSKDHKARVRSIVKAIPTNHQQWLSARLADSNSKTLAMRLRELMKHYRKVIKPIVADDEWFNKAVRDTRNYFTHYNPSSRVLALDGPALHINAQRLTILLQACLLRDLGFTLSEVESIFVRFERFNQLSSVRDHFAAGSGST